MNIPKELYAGDSATWEDGPASDRLGDVIDSTWTLKYVIAGATALTLTATADGDGWSTTISKTETTALGAGEYYWQAYAETGSRRETLGSGRITIKSTAGNAVTGKSQTRQDLDAVQAAIRAIVSGGVKSYTIGGRSLTKVDLPELIALESRYKARLAREESAEKIANGLGNPRSLFVRFKN